LNGDFAGPGFFARCVFDGKDDLGSGSDGGVLPVIPGIVGLRELDQGVVAWVVAGNDREVVWRLTVLPSDDYFLALGDSFRSVDGDILGESGECEGSDGE